MPKPDDNKGSGSDGSWFLEAVGAVPPAPTPRETIAALETDNTIPDMTSVPPPDQLTVTVSSLDGSTGTSTSTFEHPQVPDLAGPDITGEMDALPLQNVDLVDEGDDLNPVLRTRRPFRWPALIFGGFIIAVAALATLWLPTALKQDAIVAKQSYADASLALRQELPQSQSALDTITDPLSAPSVLSSVVPGISRLDSAAHELSTAASEPLPRQIPIFPVDEITSLEPVQVAAQINAARGSDIARQLADAYVYRTTIPSLLATGELPTSADVQTINALSVSLASSLVHGSAALSDLSTAQATANVNNLAHASVERYALWQDEYLIALAEGDEKVAVQLIAELDDLRSGLAADLEIAMATMRVEIDVQIVELAGDLETYLEEITR